MERAERFYKIGQLLKNNKWVSKDRLLDELGVSIATFKRDLQYLRDRMGMPIEWSRERASYQLGDGNANEFAYELPGLWFTPQEIQALLTLQHWVCSQDVSVLLAQHLAPLTKRLDRILGDSPEQQAELKNRVRIIGLGQRTINPRHFQQIGAAVIHRQRLRITYHARGSNQVLEREVSPQRLVHYRDNWYLDAWCHTRQALRSFAVDAMQSATLIEEPAQEVSDQELDATFAAGYGIFSGSEVTWATLRFDAERARWVANEHWHPQQQGRMLPDGRYELRLPYADERELVMDILRHGAHCEVLEPQSLRKTVTAEVARMQTQYFSELRAPGSRGEPEGA